MIAAGWGGRIDQLWQALGYTSHGEFADALHVGSARISHWVNETGDTVRLKSLKKMAGLTGNFDAAYRWLREGGEMPELGVNAPVNRDAALLAVASELKALAQRLEALAGTTPTGEDGDDDGDAGLLGKALPAPPVSGKSRKRRTG